MLMCFRGFLWLYVSTIAGSGDTTSDCFNGHISTASLSQYLPLPVALRATLFNVITFFFSLNLLLLFFIRPLLLRSGTLMPGRKAQWQKEGQRGSCCCLFRNAGMLNYFHLFLELHCFSTRQASRLISCVSVESKKYIVLYIFFTL